MQKRKFIRNVIFAIAILCYVVFVYSVSDNSKNWLSLRTSIQFGIIGIISIISILLDERMYSLNKMHWYFIAIFMWLAPLSQLLSGYSPWHFRSDERYIYIANWLIILWSVFYTMAYHSKAVFIIRINHSGVISRQPHDGSRTNRSLEINLKKSSQYVMLALSVVATLLMISIAGFRGLFIRGTEILADSSFGIMFNYLFRSIPAISCGILIRGRKQDKSRASVLIIIVIFVCTLILNSPVALSRYWTGVIYLGLLICFLPDKFFSGRKFDIYILAGLIILFPFLYLFKRYTLSDVLHMQGMINLADTYLSVDFDAHSMLCRIVQYVDTNGLQYGLQLRSVLLFFVPRSIWNIKGIPTGSLVAGAQGSSFTNVSAPIMGEGYIDFSWIGVLIYALIFGYLLKKLDRAFWDCKADNRLFVNQIVHPFMMGFVLFLMRGALQPAFLRLMGFFLYLILIVLFRKIISINRRI